MNAPVRGESKLGGAAAYDGSAPEDSEGFLEFDLMALYRTLRKHLGLIVSVTLGLTALAMVVVLQQTPQYTAETQVLLDPSDRSSAEAKAFATWR